jgi:hypothetical protein
MLSKQQIMQEWRDFVRRKDEMTRAYTGQHAPVVDVDCPASVSTPEAPPPPSAARAAASLTW